MEYTAENYQTQKALGQRRSNGIKPLKKLSSWHKKALLFHLAGFSNSDIAAAFNKTDSTISLILSDPLSQTVIERIHKGYDHEFRALYGKAVEGLRNRMDDSDPMVQLRAIDSWMRESARREDRKEGIRSAEDVIQAIYDRIGNTNIQINVGGNQ
ncbi:hypothetical protein LCGC14_1538740 [marine sediment metagenome]|uniref:Uncharacterized protein n=1 Tax=marine sediment metagenome TaxID=412755 RepID=A0A0F9ITR5_9ZZZZ